LLSTPLRTEDAAQVIATLFPFPEGVDPTKVKYDDLSTGQKRSISRTQEQRAQVINLYTSSPVRAEENTAWGLYNAVTEWADWASPVKGDDRDAARAEKVLMGETETLKDRALVLLGA